MSDDSDSDEEGDNPELNVDNLPDDVGVSLELGEGTPEAEDDED